MYNRPNPRDRGVRQGGSYSYHGTVIVVILGQNDQSTHQKYVEASLNRGEYDATTPAFVRLVLEEIVLVIVMTVVMSCSSSPSV